MGLNRTYQMIILVFGVSLTVAVNESSQLHVPCKPGWYFFGEKCYKYIVSGDLYPEDLCANYEGQVASIPSKEVQEFLTVFLLFNIKADAFIGLHSNGTRMNFYWEDGSIYNYTNWDRNEPSLYQNYIQTLCAGIMYKNFRAAIGKWRSLPCFLDAPVICQVKKNEIESSPDPRFCTLEEGGGWKYLNSCYHIVNEEKSWRDADKYCGEKYEGHLVSILDYKSDQFLNYIQILSNFSENAWIGIKIRNNSMQKWASGWHVANNIWNQERSQFVNDTCVLKSNRNSLEVASCLNKYPFICEKLKDNIPVFKQSPSDDWKCPRSSIKWLDLSGEYCYYIETGILRNWLEANYECGRIGGTLASIHSEEETNILHSHLLKTQEKLFIGLRVAKRRPGNNFYGFEWADGTDVVYRNWDIFHFNILGRCGELTTETMIWNKVSCNISQGYICKSKKVFSKLRKMCTPVSFTSAANRIRDKLHSGCVSAGTVVGIVFCTLLIALLVGIAVYHFRDFWKRYFMRNENAGFTTAPGFISHVSEKVIWIRTLLNNREINSQLHEHLVDSAKDPITPS